MSIATNNLVNGGTAPKVRVRGLRAPHAGAPVHLCLHCGLPVAGAKGAAGDFCCAGCAYVYRLVHEQGFESYYKIRDRVIAPADESVFQPRDYAWLAQLQRKAEERSATPELVLELEGISCAACVWLIEKVFHRAAGALLIETDAQLGRTRLRWRRGEFDAVAFARTLQSFNYLLGAPGESAPANLESRQLARRIGLAAAFSMNVMLFTLPTYFGMESTFPYARLFSTLSLVFATLSVIASGSYFLQRAWAAVRHGAVHIDIPIAVGIVGAYVGSFYGWLSGHEEFVYFDFVAAFILLMLIGRWAQTAAVERNRRRLLRSNAHPSAVRVEAHDGVVETALDDLKAGDVFQVRPGQPAPVASRLLSPQATFGTAWITGEAEPRSFVAGSHVPSGAINLGRGELRLVALQTWKDSLLSQLFRPAERASYRHRFLDRVISGYLIAIFGIAAATGAGWWVATHDAVATWSVVTAVLVVSCPCAIGLAFPLTEEIATTSLRRAGVFLREPDLWPRLAKVRRLVFDKTGTLTLDRPALANADALDALPPAARAALLAIVQDNAHPVSRALHEELLLRFPAFAPAHGEISEELGLGVWLAVNGAQWTLGRPGWGNNHAVSSADKAGAEYDTEFACGREVVARFRFADALRDGVAEELAQLRRRGLEIFLLSGDRADKVAKLADRLGIPRQNLCAEATPAGKAAWIRRLDRADTMMIGDGANDSLAFDAAFARGTPVTHRGVLESKADFYYTGRGFAGLRTLFETDDSRRRAQTWLLVFSIAYNLLAVGLAAAALMSPLLAAILMPLSSLATLAIVWWGMRRRPITTPA